MVNRLLQPQEIEVFYILPTVRKEIAQCMKASGKPQKEIAKLLGVTDAAVSQYLSYKRAANFEFKGNMKNAIREAAGRINNDVSLFRELQKLMSLAREERVICQLHASLGSVPFNCKVCFEQG
ncbi:helix-turn-helix domain-containing protein [Candidatus Woesearchaeota archaeon]|nr:helix-turn-helix domain-containing protein [Candidatus Woesearchaeota archaeon]